MLAKDLMNSPVITLPLGATLADAADRMLVSKVGSIVVVKDSGEIAGIITQSDFAAKEVGVPFSLYHAPQVLGRWMGNEGVEGLYKAARATLVDVVMQRPVVTAHEDETLEVVLSKMLKHDINHVVIVREDRPVGMIARHDLLRLMARDPSR